MNQCLGAISQHASSLINAPTPRPEIAFIEADSNSVDNQPWYPLDTENKSWRSCPFLARWEELRKGTYVMLSIKALFGLESIRKGGILRVLRWWQWQ